MSIFDTSYLKARAREFLALAHEANERGQIGFAQQLRAQARKYLRECAAMGTDCEDVTDSVDEGIKRPGGRQ